MGCLCLTVSMSRSLPILIPPVICSPAPFSGRTGVFSTLMKSAPSVLPVTATCWTAILLSSMVRSAASSLSILPVISLADWAAGMSKPEESPFHIIQFSVLSFHYSLKTTPSTSYFLPPTSRLCLLPLISKAFMLPWNVPHGIWTHCPQTSLWQMPPARRRRSAWPSPPASRPMALPAVHVCSKSFSV